MPPMKRVPIGFTEAQRERLRQESARRHRSVGVLVREAVDRAYPDERLQQVERRARARAGFGRFHSGAGDIAERHDDYLEEIERW